MIFQVHLLLGGYTPGKPSLPMKPDSPVRTPPHVKTGLGAHGDVESETCSLWSGPIHVGGANTGS